MANTRVQTERIHTTKTTTIANGSASTSSCDKGGFTSTGIVIYTLSASATVGFAVSLDDSTYFTLEDPEGTAVGWAATTGSCALCAPSALEPWPYVKLVYGAAQSASATQLWSLQG